MSLVISIMIIKKFCELLKVIKLSKEDKLFILGDLFDRSDYNPNLVDLYFKVMELGDNCSMIRGNHDEWLAAYIFKFYQIPEWKRRKKQNHISTIHFDVLPAD